MFNIVGQGPSYTIHAWYRAALTTPALAPARRVTRIYAGITFRVRNAILAYRFKQRILKRD